MRSQKSHLGNGQLWLPFLQLSKQPGDRAYNMKALAAQKKNPGREISLGAVWAQAKAFWPGTKWPVGEAHHCNSGAGGLK